ncbi:uncharacterized protein, partial [Typha angustifolia]|uniref:uncharacterized protein n=1 Tax=Typha angustifolia TaxID=59011 RepID=UPI003C2CAF79
MTPTSALRDKQADLKSTTGMAPLEAKIKEFFIVDERAERRWFADDKNGFDCDKHKGPRQLGHRSSDCPLRKFTHQSNLIEQEDELTNDEGQNEYENELEDNISKDEAIGDTEGQLLVMHRVMLTPRAPHEDVWLRRSLFRTTCTSNEKLCSVIIDSGSTENFVAQEMVDKLNLKTDKLHKPYKIAWFKGGGEVPVTTRCLIKFSIGKSYKVEVWCDVVPMDVCHVLLGRPWQYDRKIMHNGEKNTYTFIKDNVQVTLHPQRNAPYPRKQETKSHDNKTMMILEKNKFQHDMIESPVVYALMSKEIKETSNIPLKIQPLLSEFSDLTPDELPNGLPPLCEIQHRIDLIPGASLPHLPHYRMSPFEHEELYRQVSDLLKKGYIKESLSPVAVPALLTPKKDGSWRMCVDSRAINKITIKYRFPIPRLDDMLDMLSGAKVFSKIDLRSGYHQIRVRPGDEWKTAFKTKEGLYEWLVMPFGLSNAPSTFMRTMNHVLRPFIGYIVSTEGIKVDPDKVEAIKSWPTPRNSQKNLSKRHAKWSSFLQEYTFHLRHKAGVSNRVADALSRRSNLLVTMSIQVVGIESIKGQYSDDPYFGPILQSCQENGIDSTSDFLLHEGYLFRGTQLCIPVGSLRENLIHDLHSGGLGGHFGQHKTKVPSIGIGIGIGRSEKR